VGRKNENRWSHFIISYMTKIDFLIIMFVFGLLIIYYVYMYSLFCLLTVYIDVYKQFVVVETYDCWILVSLMDMLFSLIDGLILV
jgi:hypothetical protein